MRLRNAMIIIVMILFLLGAACWCAVRFGANATAVLLLVLLLGIAFLAAWIYVVILIVKALKKYLNSSDVRKAKNEMTQSLGETIKEHRTRCKMTQEFVAESLGVSRQAVSKWERGTAEPSTSNLLALAKLFGVSAEELLRDVQGRCKD